MLTKDAVNHYGSKAALASAIGVTAQSINSWGRYVPYLRQIQLQDLTSGALRAETVEERSQRLSADGRRNASAAA